MPDIELQRFRSLRKRANSLLQNLVGDLKPFRHSSVEHGFLRTPDSQSIPNDTNVTTTCSCLMALALTGRLSEFYADDPADTPNRIFSNIFAAPWMSSGLAENNA